MTNKQRNTEPATNAALTDDELNLIVGGSIAPNDPVGEAASAADVDRKATPILM
jgi:hypothetical protein